MFACCYCWVLTSVSCVSELVSPSALTGRRLFTYYGTEYGLVRAFLFGTGPLGRTRVPIRRATYVTAASLGYRGVRRLRRGCGTVGPDSHDHHPHTTGRRPPIPMGHTRPRPYSYCKLTD